MSFCQGGIAYYPASYITEDDQLEEEIKAKYRENLKNVDSDLSSRQRKYIKDHIFFRKEALLKLIKSGELIIDGTLHEYAQEILNKISDSPRRLFIVRSEAPNAFNTGDDNVYIHLGLLQRITNEAELAFVLAHELGHNEMDHFEKKSLAYESLKHNDSIKKKIWKIKHSHYGHVTALNELMLPWILANSENSRQYENDADDFAYSQLEKIGYNPWFAQTIFDILERAEHEIDTTFIDFNKVLGLSNCQSDYTRQLNFEEEASLGTFTKVKDTLEDLLRTHPFSADRKLTWLSNAELDSVSASIDFYEAYGKLAEREVIVSSMINGSIDRALFYLMQLYTKDTTSIFCRKLIPFCFAYLAHEKINRRAGKLINSQSPYSDENYNRTIQFLRRLSPDQCLEITKSWNARVGIENKKVLTNANMAIISLIAKDREEFDLRMAREGDPEYFYIFRILEKIINY